MTVKPTRGALVWAGPLILEMVRATVAFSFEKTHFNMVCGSGLKFDPTI